MYLDAFTRLGGSTATDGTPGTPFDLDPATAAAGLLSEHHIDLRSDAIGEGADRRKLVVTINEEDVDSAAANTTVEFRLIVIPKTTLVAFTFVDGDVSAANDTITEPNHGIPDGTCIVLTNSGGALPAGLAVSTHYFVKVIDENTIKLTLDPRLRVDPTNIVNITAAAGGGTHTATLVPTVIGSSGPVPKKRLRIGDRLEVHMNPLPISPVSPRHRFLLAQVLTTHDLTAGKCFLDLVLDGSQGNNIYYPTSVEVL